MNHTAVRTPEASTRPCPALVRQHLQDRTVAIAAGREFHGADVGRGGIHGQMDLAPPASALHPMLARPPLSIAEKPDAGAVNQQVQGAIGAPMRHLDGERLLPTAQGRVVGHRPVHTGQLQQAGNHPGRLSERQLEQDLDGQPKLDRRIREQRGATEATVMRREPGHLLVQPDQ